MRKRILHVDPDPAMTEGLQAVSNLPFHIDSCSDFPTARKLLLEDGVELLVTNLRLGVFNGLHLVYLASVRDAQTRAVVYSSYVERALIEEARRIGAFYELPQRLPYALAGYARSPLPPHDRRSPYQFDRRRLFRGGRRSADVAVT